jgi:hypothetical protein
MMYATGRAAGCSVAGGFGPSCGAGGAGGRNDGELLQNFGVLDVGNQPLSRAPGWHAGNCGPRFMNSRRRAKGRWSGSGYYRFDADETSTVGSRAATSHGRGEHYRTPEAARGG